MGSSLLSTAPLAVVDVESRDPKRTAKPPAVSPKAAKRFAPIQR